MSNIKINDLGNVGTELFDDANGVMAELQDNELGLTGGFFSFRYNRRNRSYTRVSYSKKSYSFSYSYRKNSERVSGRFSFSW